MSTCRDNDLLVREQSVLNACRIDEHAGGNVAAIKEDSFGQCGLVQLQLRVAADGSPQVGRLGRTASLRGSVDRLRGVLVAQQIPAHKVGQLLQSKLRQRQLHPRSPRVGPVAEGDVYGAAGAEGCSRCIDGRIRRANGIVGTVKMHALLEIRKKV